MTQRPDGTGDLGSRSFHNPSSTLTPDRGLERPDDRPQTSSTNNTSPTPKSGVTIDELIASDIVIAVMGPTGAGKSTFINKASRSQQAAIGCSLSSCTQEVQQISYVDEGRGARIVLVDTPGFDDTNESDLEILRRISGWLKATDGQGILLSGILLFHRISDIRMGGTLLRTMKMFQDLCGEDALSNVILVTTMWDEVTPEQGQQNEEELQGYLQPMLDHGARMLRSRQTEASAHAIISRFRRGGRSLLIQDQMKKGKAWYETSAAATILGPLAKLVEKILGLIHRLDRLIRKERDPVKRLKLSKKKDLRASSLSELIGTQTSTSVGSSLQRSSTIPSTYPPRSHLPTLPDIIFGDQRQASPTSYLPPARSCDSPTEQAGELRRLCDLIPVSKLRDALYQMLDIIEQLEPSDESIVPLVESIGLLTVAFAGHVQGQPSGNDVKHTVDQFQKLLTQVQDQLRNILVKRRQPTSDPPATLPQPPAQANDPTTETQSWAPLGGSNTPDLLLTELVETSRRMEALLKEVCDQPRTFDVSDGGKCFYIHGDYRSVSYLWPPPRPQPKDRPEIPKNCTM